MNIVRKALSAFLIAVLLFHFLPSPNSNRKTSEASPALPLIVFVAIGGAIGGISYVARWFFETGGDLEKFDVYKLAANITIGAASALAPHLILKYGVFWLYYVYYELFMGPSEVVANDFASRVLEEPLANAFKFIHETQMKINAITISYLYNLILNHSQEIEEEIMPIIERIENASAFVPEAFNNIQINADFNSEGIVTKNISINTYEMNYNLNYKKSWRMLTPGQSYLIGTFNLDSIPSGALLDLIHLTAYAEGVPGDGYSPIDIIINGNLFLDNYDVAQNHDGSHGYERDRWQVSDYLVSGENTIRIEFEDDPWAYTHYWIQNLSIYSGAVEIDHYIEITDVSLNKSEYVRGESAVLTVYCEDQSENLLDQAQVSYAIKDDNSVLKTGNCIKLGGGEYQATFNTNDLGKTGDFEADVIAKLTGYSCGIGSASFSVKGEPGELTAEPVKIDFSLSPDSSTSKSITLKNIGGEPLPVTVSKSGYISSWITYNENTFEIDGGNTKTFNFDISVPSNVTIGNTYSGNLVFSSSGGNVSVAINVYITNFSPGEHYIVLDTSGEIDGFTNYPVSLTKYYRQDIMIDDSGADTGIYEDSFSLSEDEYDRLASIYMDLEYTKLKDLSNHILFLKYNGEVLWKSFSVDVGETRQQIEWITSETKKDQNDFMLGLWIWVHEANKTEWRLDRVAFYHFLNLKAWKGNLNISQSDLDKIQAGWSSGYIEAQVNSVEKGGPLYLFVNGKYANSVGVRTGDEGDIIKLYIPKSLKDSLSTSNVFHIKGSREGRYNDTKITLGEIGCRLKFFEGEPNLKVTKSVSPSQITVGQTATVTITLENIGSNVAWSSCFEDTLPEGFELVSGRLDNCYGVNPLDSKDHSYQIKANISGEYYLPSLQVNYEDPSGNTYQTTSNSPVISVQPPPPPQLVLSAAIDKNEYVEGEKINLTAVLKDDDNNEIDEASITYSVTFGDSEILNGLFFNDNNGDYSADINAPIDPVSYNINIVADKEGYEADSKQLSFKVKDTTDPAVSLLTPNGGELWKIGDTYDITWEAIDNIEVYDIKLEYSTDGGTNFNLITDSISNTGSYPWEVPSEPSGSCKIRVTVNDDAGNDASDSSDDNFTISTIVTGSLSVTIFPQEAIDLGGQWKLSDEEEWHNSGDIISCSPGEYTLGFKAINGWSKPDDKQVQINLGQTTNEIGTYEQIDFVVDKEIVDVPEGGKGEFQVMLSNKPSSDVSVTVSRVSGDQDISVKPESEMKFTPDNWNTYQTVTLEAAEDDDAEDGEATIRISAPDIPDKDVTAREQDNDELLFETDIGEVIVPEGGEESFQVRLTAKPLSDVTVSVSRVNGDEDISVKTGSELTFTPDNWDVWQTILLEAAEDDDAEDGEATIRISAADIPDKDVTAREQDKDELLFVTDKDEVIVPEGGEGSFQVKLTARPLLDLAVMLSRVSGDEDISVKTGSELTFTPDNWDVWQTVLLEAAEDDDVAEGETTIRISATDIPDKYITAREQDNGELLFETDIGEVIIPEGGEGSFQVKLTAKPLLDLAVMVSRVSGDEDISVKTGSELTFTPDNWDVWQTILLEAAEDDDAADGEATIRISAADIPDKNVTAREQDNDELEFGTDLEMDDVIVPEGGEGSFQVKLMAKPLSAVSVTVSRVSGDENISIKTGSELTFSPNNWDVWQTVLLEAAEDDDAEDGKATIRISAADIPDMDVTAREQDNDELEFETDLEIDEVSVPEGGEESFQVRFTAKPTADVTVTVIRISGDEDISVKEGSELTFTPDNWNTYQMVTLEALEDDDIINGEATIRISETDGTDSEIPDKDITAREEDNDELYFVIDEEPIEIPEGGTGDFNVKLSAQPTSNLLASVNKLSGDEDITVGENTELTFTPDNWNVWQEVLLEASEDDDCLDGEAIIRISGTGEDEIESKDVIAKEEDNDFGGISLGFNPSSGAWGDIIKLLVNISNNCQSISAFGFELVYDDTLFIYKGVDKGLSTSDWSLIEGNEISPGRIRIGGIVGGGTTINNDSDGSLVEITLQIQCLDYIEETELQLNIENYMDDIERFLPNPCTTDFTFVPCPILGDVNADGIVTPGDAQKAFEIAIGKLTPDLCQEMASNANCDEEVTFIDAQNIFDHYLGKVVLPECCAEFDGSSSAMSTRNLERIKWLQPQNPIIYPLDTIALSGEIVKVPIIITNAEGISSFSFDVNYSPEALEFIGLERSPLTHGFADLRGEKELDGLVRIERETHMPIRDTSFGSLAVMVFRVKAGIGNELPIFIINPSEELFDVEIGEGTFIGLAHSEDETRYLNLGSAIYMPDGTLRIPVNVSSAFNLKSFGMTIQYSAEKMLFIGANKAALTEGFIALDANELEAGIVRVGGFSMSGIQDRGPGLLVQLVFFIKEKGGLVEIISLEDDIHDYVIQDKTIEIK